MNRRNVSKTTKLQTPDTAFMSQPHQATERSADGPSRKRMDLKLMDVQISGASGPQSVDLTKNLHLRSSNKVFLSATCNLASRMTSR